MFAQLKTGLAKPLAGMGTAFSPSMFGLSGALILGFLDLTAGQAMNRFSTSWRNGWPASQGLARGPLPVMAKPACRLMCRLCWNRPPRIWTSCSACWRARRSRVQSNNALRALADRMADLGDTLRLQQQLMEKIASAQLSIAPLMNKLNDARTLTMSPARICAISNCC